MIVVGERVNATRSSIARAIRERDADHIAGEIRAQDRAGADYLDLNAGTGSGDRREEIEALEWLVDLALEVTDKRLCLDASDPEVLRAAAEHLGDRRPMMLNSLSGEEERLEALLPVARERECPVVALAMDSSGIPADMERRLDVCEAILAAAARAGVAEEMIYLDPLVLPLSADPSTSPLTLDTLREIKRRHPAARTTLGLTNVSHGLPRRQIVNSAFLIAALAAGLDSAICDPTRPQIRQAILLGELVAGKDRLCRRFVRQARKGEL